MRARRWFPFISLVVGLVSLPLSVIGQWQLDRRVGGGRTGWLLMGVAALFFLVGFSRSSIGEGAGLRSRRFQDDRPWGIVLAALGAAAALGSYAFLGANRLTLVGVLLWQGGLVVFIGGTVGWRVLAGAFSRAKSFSVRLSAPIVALAIITLIGAFLRLWQIAELPAEPGVDLPLILMNVEKVLEGEWPIFFTLHPGREGLYVYLAAGYVKLFGLSYPALRTFGALLGTLTIPLVYLLGRQLYDEEAGLLAAVLLALSRWHIILSRTGLRFILMPIFTVLLVMALAKALRGLRPLHWVGVGLVLGWGFHTYSAWLIMPVLVITGWLVHQALTRDWSQQATCGLLLALAIAALLVVPLLRVAHDDPEIVGLRVLSRVTGRRGGDSLEECGPHGPDVQPDRGWCGTHQRAAQAAAGSDQRSALPAWDCLLGGSLSAKHSLAAGSDRRLSALHSCHCLSDRGAKRRPVQWDYWPGLPGGGSAPGSVAAPAVGRPGWLDQAAGHSSSPPGLADGGSTRVHSG
jgi:hypothetical protein